MSVTLNQLFESKVHLGHLTRYWNPKMAPFIFGKQNGMHQIDLDKTRVCLDKALAFLRELGARQGSKVLFVGTKRIAQSIIKEQATRCGMPYVDQYWQGGNLTNYSMNSLSAKTLKNMEAMRQQENFGTGMTKKEIRNFERCLARLEKRVGGIKDMAGLPDALVIIDIGKERNAVREARDLNIPIIGVVDTNYSPDAVNYIVPGNDDSMASIRLYMTLAADAILEGRASIQESTASSYTAQPIIKRIKKSATHVTGAAKAAPAHPNNTDTAGAAVITQSDSGENN
jgi:small subunit ribosomal protein S2